MVIIADGGSTKTNWCLIDDEGTRIYFNTEGYNPDFVGTEAILASLRQNLPDTLAQERITEVHYYGAGISSARKAEIVAAAMRQVFTAAKVVVDHDLLAAARALLGTGSGFAAILGTGTNSCLYDGQKITYSVDSLGYFLGDEGSGSFIGKRLLRDYLRNLLPDGLQESFRETYGLNRDEILDKLYNQPLPNRFLASFAKFAYDHNNVSYCREIVLDGFETFFQNLVMHYPRYQDYTFNCIGSVGYNFRDALAQVAKSHDMEVGKIIRSPIDDLVDYHTILTK
ncbi:BadF/BadG/BcrA/BcrD ATPase family protein [Hymenobacter daecheongensis DSM 21074]|uniref:BadF/BadG/BcrA/BcrD ATPase family protein n=1 Tax=Hymenobacter daecheongensis DSM 21074 TaxID=1121955 RepID=A0A1M6ES56_9BACT|nr:BadF/BadG/BcrA/BcrD ATPase family protein [Hymenobacter daecheongensis]SHI88248.1 BadF/BadG/BcrA/BcrD ATPase family protein [Hymenobacter daecheongensis DSM 21074]